MIVTVEVPGAAVLLADKDITPLLLNDAVTPVGRPDAVYATVPLNPFFGVTVMVLVPLVPCVSAKLVGEADRLKSGVAVTAGVNT